MPSRRRSHINERKTLPGDLTDSIRAHFYGCAMLPAEVRRRAQAARIDGAHLEAQATSDDAREIQQVVHDPGLRGGALAISGQYARLLKETQSRSSGRSWTRVRGDPRGSEQHSSGMDWKGRQVAFGSMAPTSAISRESFAFNSPLERWLARTRV
jgi:hypothetical protein